MSFVIGRVRMVNGERRFAEGSRMRMSTTEGEP